jgi:aquaporin Z
MLHRKLVAEAVGTALLVFLAVGVATLSFGFKLTGQSTSAGVVATAFSPRSLGPAIIVGGKALSQVWLFLVAPPIGGALAALFYRYLVPTEVAPVPPAIAEGEVERTTATP